MERCFVRAPEQFRRLFAGKPPWRVQVLAPVLVVVGLWIVMSVGTTFYLRWVEAAYDRVFSENLTSISAAHSPESIGWLTLAEWADPSLDMARFQSQWENGQPELQDLGHQESVSAHTPQEKETAEELRLAVEQIHSAITTELSVSLSTEERSEASGRRIRGLAEKLSTSAVRLRKINDELITVARSQLAGTHSLVLVTRMLMLMLGPLIGKFERCHQGTIFLDEVGDMPLPTQARILRLLQDGQFQRVGGNETLTVDVRIIAATNQNVESMISDGRFRQDLYDRLRGVTILLPPL